MRRHRRRVQDAGLDHRARQVYSAEISGLTIAASSVGLLVRLLGERRVDEAVPAARLVAPTGPPWPLFLDTVVRGVRTLRTGHWLRLDAAGRERQVRWWTLPPATLSLAEGAEAVRAALLVGTAASAAATQALGLHFVFGAFLFGLIVPREGAQRLRAGIRERVEGATTLLMPVYFVVAGFAVDLSHLHAADLRDLAAILATAMLGKFGGAFLGARVQGLPARPAALLAVLMNTRGLTELIVLSVGLQMGVLNTGTYSLPVVMAVVTTAVSGPLLHLLHAPQNPDPAPVADPAAASAEPESAAAQRLPMLMPGRRRWTVR